jgi:hypothetical protein
MIRVEGTWLWGQADLGLIPSLSYSQGKKKTSSDCRMDMCTKMDRKEVRVDCVVSVYSEEGIPGHCSMPQALSS